MKNEKHKYLIKCHNKVVNQSNKLITGHNKIRAIVRCRTKECNKWVEEWNALLEEGNSEERRKLARCK